MKKADLINRLAEKLDIPQKQAIVIADAFIKVFREAIEDGEEIELRGLFSLRIREYGPRPGRNPKTGEEVEIPARKRILFRLSRSLRIG